MAHHIWFLTACKLKWLNLRSHGQPMHRKLRWLNLWSPGQHTCHELKWLSLQSHGQPTDRKWLYIIQKQYSTLRGLLFGTTMYNPVLLTQVDRKAGVTTYCYTNPVALLQICNTVIRMNSAPISHKKPRAQRRLPASRYCSPSAAILIKCDVTCNATKCLRKRKKTRRNTFPHPMAAKQIFAVTEPIVDPDTLKHPASSPLKNHRAKRSKPRDVLEFSDMEEDPEPQNPIVVSRATANTKQNCKD
ncbi:hypothetical protein M422DRAFT_242267 [Sphaerobolus stellatus SS14]|nr:hypothetical protein M422DRAFT_242267 [Sphaerobolus stellatus SS14]